jgi:DNA-binding transcriptional LysR family regulator
MSARSGRISLDNLESFVTAAEAGSVTAAARHLGLSQPTITQRLQRLEAHIGRPLMIRGAAGTILTTDGARLLPLARALLRLDEQIAPAGDVPLRLGACSNIGIFLLPEILASFSASGGALPELRIGSNPEIGAALEAGELDVALLEWWDGRRGFEAVNWRDEPLVAILPPDDPLALDDAVALVALRGRRLLGGEAGTGTGRLVRSGLKDGVPLETAMSLGSTEAVKRAVAAGLGTSLIMAACADAVAHRYAVRPLSPPLSKTLQLIWREGIDPGAPLLQHLQAQATHRLVTAARTNSM